MQDLDAASSSGFASASPPDARPPGGPGPVISSAEPASVAAPSDSDPGVAAPVDDAGHLASIEADRAQEVEPEPVARPGRPLPRIISVSNQKGGVGKTTTTVNLGAALAEADQRVLVIDLDPQGNATTGLGINNRQLDHSIYDVLLNDVPLDDCIVPTELLNLFVAPASLDLAGAEIELVPAFSREMRLKHAIDTVRDDYDYILIDCQPSCRLS